MRLQIEAEPSGGLRLVRDLPLSALGRLEGYNGIGKSAALRLLQVCVGEQPYLPEEQRLWDSFRSLIAPCLVTLQGVAGTGTLQWDLDPELWPSTIDQPIEQVGRIRLNGQEVELDEVRRLLRVERIVGNEGLIPTLIRQLRPHRAALADAFGEGSTFVRRSSELDEVLHRAEDLARRIAGPDLSRLRAEAQAAQSAQQFAASAASAARAKADRVDEVDRLVAQLAEVESGADDLAAKESDLLNRITAVDEALGRLDQEIAAAGARADAQPDAVHELELSQRNAARWMRSTRDATMQCQATAHALGLAGDPLMIDAAKLRVQWQSKIAEISAQLATVFTAPRVADLAERVLAVLRDADDLRDEAIDDGDEDRPAVTIGQLKDRLAKTATRLRRLEPPERVEALREQLARLNRSIHLAEALEAEQAEAIRRTRLSEQAQARLIEASERLAGLSGQRLSDLIASRERLNAELTQLAVERVQTAEARQSLGGGLSRDQLKQRITDALQLLGLERAAFEEAAANVHVAAAEAELASSVATREHDQAQDAERAARAQVQAALSELLRNSDFDWMQKALPALVLSAAPLADKQSALRLLLRQIERARVRAERVSAVPDQLIGVLDALERQLATQSNTAGSTQPALLTAARTWFAAEIRGWFNQPVVREVLFAGASDVRVDLLDMSVAWSLGDEQFVRPLTAFSSGEQAFAYTRARLAVLDAEADPREQIIALDEFGAFISRNWLSRLESYLQERVVRHPRERLLLVLPLTRTEAELRQSGTPERLLEQAEQDGYFVRTIDDREP